MFLLSGESVSRCCDVTHQGDHEFPVSFADAIRDLIDTMNQNSFWDLEVENMGNHYIIVLKDLENIFCNKTTCAQH